LDPVSLIRSGNETYLACTVVAQQREDLILVHRKRQVVDHHVATKGLAQLMHRDAGLAQGILVGTFVVNTFDESGFVGNLLLLGVLGDDLLLIRQALAGGPIRRQQKEIHRLRQSILGGPDLREIPREAAVNENVRKLHHRHTTQHSSVSG
jgi:hypothetical protein